MTNGPTDGKREDVRPFEQSTSFGALVVGPRFPNWGSGFLHL